VVDHEHQPEIIRSNDVIHRGDIGGVETRGEIIKIKASIWITFGALVVACLILLFSIYMKSSELQTWSTGLISMIAGAAISYGFAGRK
jgi:hypothetical protein